MSHKYIYMDFYYLHYHYYIYIYKSINVHLYSIHILSILITKKSPSSDISTRWLRLRGDGHLRCHAVRTLRLGSNRFGSVRDLFGSVDGERTGELGVLLDFNGLFGGLLNPLFNGF